MVFGLTTSHFSSIDGDISADEDDTSPILPKTKRPQAISFTQALLLPGVAAVSKTKLRFPGVDLSQRVKTSLISS